MSTIVKVDGLGEKGYGEGGGGMTAMSERGEKCGWSL